MRRDTIIHRNKKKDARMTEPMESVDSNPATTVFDNATGLAEGWLTALDGNSPAGSVILAAAFVLVSLAKTVGMSRSEYLKMIELAEEAMDEPDRQD